ncbi:MAG TPA: 4Fe-4S dicluster domain-containing protein [Candidatus Angelobacter sp.]|nr:4Fe-4S dicluster domain-containing protein [Candidatus Angelobacter sp.]
MNPQTILSERNGHRTTAFLTDSTLCIGCKACEVACKEWNDLPADGFVWSGHSYDNTGAVGASTWRHVKFVEHEPKPGMGGNAADLSSWGFSSDVCKHCEVAGCLEACPTGAIVRTEFGGVYVQPDVCNGCAYCVVACPFGVVQKNMDDGRAFKCTFCYDRQKAGLEPACAKACPTQSIKFGEIESLRLDAQERVQELHRRGMEDAQLYDPQDTSVGGLHSFFIVRGDPRQYNLPPKPEVPTTYLHDGWKASAIGSGLLVAGALLAFLSSPRSRRERREHP